MKTIGILMHKALIHSKTILVGLVLSALVIGTTGCGTPDCLKRYDLRGYSVVLEKGACFGQCPSYRGTINGDLSVDFDAMAFIDPPRAPKGTITREVMCELLNEIQASAFTATVGEMAPVADAPVTKITVKLGALKHTVEWNLTVPKNLRKLHDLLEAHTYRNPTLLSPQYK